MGERLPLLITVVSDANNWITAFRDYGISDFSIFNISILQYFDISGLRHF